MMKSSVDILAGSLFSLGLVGCSAHVPYDISTSLRGPICEASGTLSTGEEASVKLYPNDYVQVVITHPGTGSRIYSSDFWIRPGPTNRTGQRRRSLGVEFGRDTKTAHNFNFYCEDGSVSDVNFGYENTCYGRMEGTHNMVGAGSTNDFWRLGEVSETVRKLGEDLSGKVSEAAALLPYKCKSYDFGE